MRINKQFILVKIDKAKQAAHQEKIGNIFISPQYLYMKFNLQYGEVIEVGQKAAEIFPGIRTGDIAMFRHTIESEAGRLLYKEDNPLYPGDRFIQDEFRVVDTYSGTEIDAPGRELLGYISKKTGEWIANDHYIYLTGIEPYENIKKLSTLIEAGDEMSEEYYMNKIEELRQQQENMKETIKGELDPYKFEVFYRHLEIVSGEMEKITNYLNSKRLCVGTVSLVGGRLSRQLDIHVGSKLLIEDRSLLYPINILDKKYFIIENPYVVAILN